MLQIRFRPTTSLEEITTLRRPLISWGGGQLLPLPTHRLSLLPLRDGKMSISFGAES